MWNVFAIIWVKYNGKLGEEAGEKWYNFRYILKVEQIGFTEQLKVSLEEKKKKGGGLKMTTKFSD